MNIKKLSDRFNTSAPNDDTFERYIQNARVNEELQKMNEEITFDYMKNMLTEIFKDNADYEVFNRDVELARLRQIIVPSEDSRSIWNPKCFAYWNPKKYAGFAVFPAEGEEARYHNCTFFIISRDKTEFKECITFANQIDDIRDKIDFYIQSFSFLHEDEEKIDFNQLVFEHNWYAYSDMKNLTTDCVKYNLDGVCDKSKCPNCDKCKQFYPMQEYTTNHYYGNQLFNKIIEMICKTTKNPVKIDSVENGAYTYTIGNIKIELTLPKRKSKKISNLKCNVYYQYPNSDTKKNIVKFNKYSAKNGRELYDLYFDLIGMLTTKKEFFNNLCVNNIK